MRISLKFNLSREWRCGPDSTGEVSGPVAGCCGKRKGKLGFHKGQNFLSSWQLSVYQEGFYYMEFIIKWVFRATLGIGDNTWWIEAVVKWSLGWTGAHKWYANISHGHWVIENLTILKCNVLCGSVKRACNRLILIPWAFQHLNNFCPYFISHHVNCAPCHQGLACPQVAGGGEGL
jgi:hypothetical protein